MTIKLNEYVPIKESICKKFVNSTKLKEIKFHEKPPKRVPLKNSENEKNKENISSELKLIFILKNDKAKVNNP